jgi:DNA-binding MurR/RpiR family transcriptional regulator
VTPGAPRKYADREVEAVVGRTLETLPREATQWNRASMSQTSGMSESTVGRTWRAFGL